MASAALLKKRLHSIPLGRKTDPALRAAVTADDPTAFQAAFLAALAKPKKRLCKYLRQSSLLAAWSVNAVDLSGRERELAASLDDLSSRSAKQSRPQKKHKGKKLKSPRTALGYDEVIANWLVEIGPAPGPWETIAIAEILLREGQTLSPENFTQALALLAGDLRGRITLDLQLAVKSSRRCADFGKVGHRSIKKSSLGMFRCRRIGAWITAQSAP